MRQSLSKSNNHLLRYPIREIAEIGKKIQTLGNFSMIWENIGDPIAAGESVPPWIHGIITSAMEDDKTFAYTDTRGDIAAREYVLEHFSNKKACRVDDILFFNGLGEAINKLFDNLPATARVLVPSPTYPSHATAEAMHAGSRFLSYSLDPKHNWEPDLEEIENKMRYNETVVAIVVINPNNPTGAVYSKKTLEKIVAIAAKNNCFVIFDEIYHHMVFDKQKRVLLADIIGDTPGISMKGMSKDIPWPGARCGWIEFYNKEKDTDFEAYFQTILLSKMLEVCSTTLPQKVLPAIFHDDRFFAGIKKRLQKYEKRADELEHALANIPHVRFCKPQGVFYAVVELLDLPKNIRLEAINKEIRLFLDEMYQTKKDISNDFYFSYELMGSHGVCVVPLSGFGTSRQGFRMTLLQEDDAIFSQTIKKIVDAINKIYQK